MSEAVPVRTLLITVFESVIEVFLLCLAGYILSRAGVTDKATQRKLNVINVSLFTPALLFSKVAFSLTPAKLKEMWIIPLGFVIVTALSAAVAWVLSKVFKLSKSQRAFAICAAMFQNSNSLPIALIQSLVVEVPHLKWDADDTKDQMLGRALTYLVLYSTLGMMLRWSVGVKLLSQADEEAPEVEGAPPISGQAYHGEPNGHGHVLSPGEMPHPGARETDPFFSTEDDIAEDEREERRNPTGSMEVARRATAERASSPTPSVPWTAQGSAHSLVQPPWKARGNSMTRDGSHQSHHSGIGAARRKPTRTESGREFWGLPQFPRSQRIMLPEDDEDSSDESFGGELSVAASPVSLRRRSAPKQSALQRWSKSAKAWSKKAWKAVNAFMTVPMYAAILSIIIALIPPLQAFLGKLKPFEQAIRSAGQCSIPVTLVVLGAFFYSPPPSPNAALPQDKSKSGAYPGENKTVFVAVMSRMIIVPLLMLPFIALIARFDLFEAAEDPVFILSATLLVSSPPALTLAQITQAASGDAFERLISKTISWSYAVLTPPLTLAYVVLGLVFGRL